MLAASLLVPLVMTIWKSFLFLDPAWPRNYGVFSGFENYFLLFSDPEFKTSTLVTAIFVGIALLQCTAAGVLALWLRWLWPARLPESIIVVLLLPLLVSPTLAGLMGRLFLNDQFGWLAHLMLETGILEEGEAPLASEIGAWIWISILDAWQWVPFTSLLFYLSFLYNGNN